MKRIILALALLGGVTPHFLAQSSSSPLNSPASLVQYLRSNVLDCSDPRVFCVGKQPNAEYSVFGGVTCSDPSDSTNDPNSALAAALPLATDPNNPVTILITRGVYPECFLIDNAQGLVVRGIGGPIIRPQVDSYDDVNGGVGRIGTFSAINSHIMLEGMVIVNNAWSFKEPALWVGLRAGQNGSSQFDGVTVRNNILIGNYSAITVRGRTNSGSALSSGRISVENNQMYAGAEGLYDEGYYIGQYSGNVWHTQSNLCDSHSYGTVTRTVETGGANDPNHVQWGTSAGQASADALDHKYQGAHFTLNDGIDVCPSGDGTEGWIFGYDGNGTTGNVAFIQPPLAVPADGNCTITIDSGIGIAGASAAGLYCGGADWGINRAGDADTYGYSDMSCVHFDFASGDSAASNNDSRVFTGGSCKVIVNDYGITGASILSSFDSADCQARGKIAAILLDFQPRESVVWDVPSEILINHDQWDALSCANPVAIVLADGGCEIEGALTVLSGGSIKSPGWTGATGDPDIALAGVVSGCHGGSSRVSVQGGSFNRSGGGSWTTVIQNSNGILELGPIASNSSIITSGTITLLSGSSSYGSATLDFGSITSDCVEVVSGGGAATVTVPGAATGDSCEVGHAVTVLKSSFTCRVSAANTVTVKHCCNNGTCDPASGTFQATVTRR